MFDMPAINDLDRTVFSNAEKTIFDNFTTEELRLIHQIATNLDSILRSASSRRDRSYPNVHSL